MDYKDFKKLKYSDSDWNEKGSSVISLSPEQKKPFPNPKFCEKWLTIFDPWLSRCLNDRNKPFCKACQISLDCNRNHLERHQRTNKHQRNLKIFLENGEEGALKNFQMCQQRNRYYLKRKNLQSNSDESNKIILDSADEELYDEVLVEDEASHDYLETSMEESVGHIEKPETKPIIYNTKTSLSSINNHSKLIKKPSPAITKKDRIKLFLQIQKDKHDLMQTFKDLLRTNECSETTMLPPKEKNHVDLFFESVSSTVKSLSPKLIAEAKMRVQQLICELELRELTQTNPVTSSTNKISPNTIVVSQNSGNSFVLQTAQSAHEQPVTHEGQDYDVLQE